MALRKDSIDELEVAQLIDVHRGLGEGHLHRGDTGTDDARGAFEGGVEIEPSQQEEQERERTKGADQAPRSFSKALGPGPELGGSKRARR